MKSVLIIIICIFALSIQSCKKNKDKGDLIVEGKVINIGTREPIESVLVILYGGNPFSNPLMPGVNTYPPNGNNDTAYSNRNGEFYLKLKDESAAYLGWIKDGYKNGKIIWYTDDDFKNISEGSGNKFFKSGTKYIIIQYEAECTFNPVFKKTGINSKNDTLIVSITTYNHPTSFSDPVVYVGKSPFIFERDRGYCTGNKYFHFKLYYTDSGIWKTKIDSVYVKSFETYSDTIYY
jgi:hypothetical protein